MDAIVGFVQHNVAYAPFIVFGLLMLAGLSLPISEDLLIIVSALLAVKHPDMVVSLFLGVYLGAYLSDLESYWVGRILGRRLWKVKFFAKLISEKSVQSIGAYYERYGTFTLLLGRFIPFGVRNALFLSAGLSRMHFGKFALTDWAACTMTNVALFSLTYFYGEGVFEYVRQGNFIIFGVFSLVVGGFFLLRKRCSPV